MKVPKIVDVPLKMQKFYGRGKMLHPTLEMVESAIQKIPVGMVTTIDDLGKKLAQDFGTDVTCPMRVGNAIKRIAKEHTGYESSTEFPFWRVIRKDKRVIKTPDFTYWASVLEREGLQLKVKNSDSIEVIFTPDQHFQF